MPTPKTTDIFTPDTLAMLPSLTLATVARIVRGDWKNVYFGAVPYLDALGTMDYVNPKGQMYLFDDAVSVVLYFLSNANGWRGDVARAVKAELKRRVA